MAYTDDAALSKLSALNDTQDSIATAAQWFLFHRKHAERTVQLWLGRLKESPSSKRLTLIYLANEVAQQSKVRRKDDFVQALSPVIADAMTLAYRGASQEVQHRLLRVLDVWKQRTVFDENVLVETEGHIQQLDRSRGVSVAVSSRGYQSPTASVVPPELMPIFNAMASAAKTVVPARSSLVESQENYNRVLGPSASIPPPPVHAARLNGLLKVLETAEDALRESVNARKQLVKCLETVLTSERQEVESDLKHLSEVTGRRAEVDAKMNEVEMEIIKGLSHDKKQEFPEEELRNGHLQPPEPHRPEMEALTPPPGDDNSSGPFELPESKPMGPPQPSGIELLSSLASQYQSVPVHTNGSNKRRKIDDEDDELPDLGADDEIDADVVEMLRKESDPSSATK